jgi:glycosyltransferase involved in cell wall biosynthesis
LRAQGYDFELRITATFEMHLEEEWIKNLGWISQDKVPELYREVDIVVVPSIWVEPFGITTLEAMASGVPVVGSRIGGIAETLVDGETGLHFEAGNVEQLTLALKRLLDSPDLRQQLGRGGRKRAVEVYDWERVVEKYYAEPFLECFRRIGLR